MTWHRIHGLWISDSGDQIDCMGGLFLLWRPAPDGCLAYGGQFESLWRAKAEVERRPSLKMEG